MYNLVLKIIPCIQFLALNPWMYDLIRYTLVVHVRIGWFESGASNYLSAKKKGGGSYTVYYIGMVTFMQIYGELTLEKMH